MVEELNAKRAAELEQQVALLSAENARLREMIDRRARRVKDMTRISNRIRSMRNLPAILQTVVEEVGVMLGASRCFIALDVELPSVPAFFEFAAEDIPPLKKPPSSIQLALNKEDTPDGTLLAMPIMLQHEILGAIGLQCKDSSSWTPSEIELITLTGSGLSMLLSNARLLAENERRARDIDQLQSVAQIVIQEQEPYRLAERLTERAAALSGAQQAMVGLVAGDVVVVDQIYERGRWKPAELKFRPGGGVMGWVLVHGRPYSSGNEEIGPDTVPLEKVRSPESFVLAVPIRNRQEQVLGVIELHKPREQQSFSQEDMDHAQTIARQAAIALDRAQLFEEMQQRARALDTLLSFSAELNEQLTPEMLIHQVVEHAVALADASAGLGGLATPEGLSSRGYLLENAWHDFEAVWSAGQGIAGWVLAHKQSYLTNDGQHNVVVDARLADVLNVRSAIGVPILDADEQMLGFFVVYNKGQGHKPFSRADVRIMESMANAAAVAIRNSRLFAELETQGSQLRALSAKLVTLLEDERRAIARELHDEAGQELVGIKLNLQLLARQLPSDLPALRAEADHLREQVNKATEKLQLISRRLRPPTLDELGLEPALRRQATDFEEKTGVIVHFDSSDPQRRLPQHVENACYRIVQEALANVMRHAQAYEVWINLQWQEQTVHLVIKDDGCGFIVGQQGEGLGLLTMQERASMLGGQLFIDSQVDKGTTVTAIIPINDLAFRGPIL